MKNRSHGFAQKLRRILRKSNYRHKKRQSGSDLLINSLAAFNFQRRLKLEFPGQRLDRAGGYSR